jgi:nitric oxide reductase NorQ protein
MLSPDSCACVTQAVGTKRQDLLEVTGRLQADVRESAQTAHVGTHLVSGRDVHTDQLQRRVSENAAQGLFAGQTRTRMNDTKPHSCSSVDPDNLLVMSADWWTPIDDNSRFDINVKCSAMMEDGSGGEVPNHARWDDERRQWWLRRETVGADEMIDANDLTTAAPFYLPVGDEREVFLAAYRATRPVLVKGPTGCGKTRFVEAMAAELGVELHTVACHEDLTTADLVGRHLIQGGDTVWLDGPLTTAVRRGGLCYLDEIVEARQDVTVVIHPLTDHRRILPIDRLGQMLHAPPSFGLVLSYNPGYQSILKDLKPSTRQRMVAIEFGFPPEEIEQRVIAHESMAAPELVEQLVKLGSAIRSLNAPGLREVASTRALVAAAALVTHGLSPRSAARAAIAEPLSDSRQTVRALVEVIDAFIPA